MKEPISTDEKEEQNNINNSIIAEITVLNNNFKYKGPVVNETEQIVEILDIKTGKRMSFPKMSIIITFHNVGGSSE